MQNEPNISIAPIFDQSVGSVWSDFTKIEVTSQKIICGYDISPVEKKRINGLYKTDWKSNKYNFAFGAYDNNQMVGFASGYRENAHDMYLHNLYVLPEYNKMGIGRRLLEQTERSSSLVSDTMTLMSLSGAVDFYIHRGYATYERRNCIKKLPRGVIGVVPVFKSVNWLRAKNRTDFDPATFRHYKHAPTFAYISLVDGAYEIDAVAIRHPNGEQDIWTNPQKPGMKDFYEQQLLKALAKVR